MAGTMSAPMTALVCRVMQAVIALASMEVWQVAVASMEVCQAACGGCDAGDARAEAVPPAQLMSGCPYCPHCPFCRPS